jgi:hypothetical protein
VRRYLSGVALGVRADDLREHGASVGREEARGTLESKFEKALRDRKLRVDRVVFAETFGAYG